MTGKNLKKALGRGVNEAAPIKPDQQRDFIDATRMSVPALVQLMHPDAHPGERQKMVDRIHHCRKGNARLVMSEYEQIKKIVQTMDALEKHFARYRMCAEAPSQRFGDITKMI
jgi:hypothetical protein